MIPQQKIPEVGTSSSPLAKMNRLGEEVQGAFASAPSLMGTAVRRVCSLGNTFEESAKEKPRMDHPPLLLFLLCGRGDVVTAMQPS